MEPKQERSTTEIEEGFVTNGVGTRICDFRPSGTCPSLVASRGWLLAATPELNQALELALDEAQRLQDELNTCRRSAGEPPIELTADDVFSCGRAALELVGGTRPETK